MRPGAGPRSGAGGWVHPLRAARRGRIAAVMRVLVAGFAGFAGICLFSSCYLTTQVSRYITIVAGAKPADRLLADPGTDGPTRKLLETALAARSYAIDTIGLRNTKNYRSLAKVDAEHLVTVVQACAELSFDRHLWAYPFVGKLPYKGFFDPKDAETEALRIKKLGLDVIRRPSDAFSTLGFLQDPLFSFMIDYDEYDVAELIIHEMTHATIFIRGEKAGNFNEELATFVGRQGALDFIAARHGEESEEYAQARAGILDARAFSAFLRESSALLERIYASPASDDDKRAAKSRVIAERAAVFARDCPAMFSREGSLRFQSYPMDKVNNALLDLYRLYEGEPLLYSRYYENICASDLATFIRRLATVKDPAAELRRED